MRYKKIIMFAILLVTLLAVSAVSAAENVTDDVVGVENQDDNVILGLDDSNSEDNVLNANPKTFNDLNDAINGNTKSDIYLNCNYAYNPDSDNFKEGININRAVTIHGNGYTINGNGVRIFRVSNTDVVFNDIIFVNGISDGYAGGAICVRDGECSAVNCIFINNFAWQGGAISGECSAVNCTFENNTAVGILGHGGAMYGGSAVNCTFIDNSALGSGNGGAMYGGSAVNCTFIDNSVFYGANGGAMYDCSAVNCTFIGNAARNYGGAMYGECSAVNCTFTGNSAEYYGGAIYAAEYSEWTILDCTFINNHAQSAGAVYVGDGECSVVNCIFQNNNVSKFGGAVYVGKGECSSLDCAFINNSAVYRGGAIYVGDGVCSAVDCIFQYNNVDEYGGAVYVGKGECSSEDCTFINNSVKIGNGGAVTVDSGGVYSAVNSIFQYNIARHNGGAIYDNNGRCSAVNCTFINNDAGYPGGAMASGSAVNCTFINNSAVYWGGAISWGSAENCIFQYNYATESGGAMYGGPAENCIFQYNRAGEFGGAMYEGSAVNSIFKYNYADEFGGAISNGSADHCTFISNAAGINGSAMYGGSAAYSTYINNDVYDVYTVYCTFITAVETAITGADLTTVYGVSKKLVATLKDVDGNLLAGEEISIVLNNKEYALKTNSKGKASLAIPTNLDPKTYVATITYAGNEEYAPSATTADVVVNKAGAVISAVYDANNNEIVATLTNANTGKAISSANVKFNLNGATATVKTNSKGQAKFSTAGLSSGTAKISYAGNSKYKSTSTSMAITVKSEIIISAVYDADNNELVATLTNGDTGKAVTSTTVQVNINGATTTAKTDTKGQAKVSTVGLPLGTNTATISYAGNSKYNPASTKITFDVKTKVIVTDVYAYSDRIVAKLTNGATGKTIANANMIVEINGVKYNAKSDNKGLLTFDTTGLNLPSSYDLTISYRGNDRYTASSATVAVDLNKANMMITTNYHADKQKMVATLKNSKTGKIVSNANMIIDLNGVKTTYKSNDQGKITLPTTDFAPGTYVGTVTYPGNARYNSISAVFKIDI